MNHRWTGLVPGTPHRLSFACYDESRTFDAEAVILALGGASWPITGSDGAWTSVLAGLGIAVNPLLPANCGWETAWPPSLLKIAEGQPLKNIVLRAGDAVAKGELMVTAYGLEGGALYQLGAALRAMPEPAVDIDFKPDFSAADLIRKMESARIDLLANCRERWKLSPAAHAILIEGQPRDLAVDLLAARAKACRVSFTAARPINEAISSAGGVCWGELDGNLMLKRIPGIFAAGEMIDWEAPTGGYLMQGCFATGTLAGKAATRV
jgi:uncharacterized flavoprotein (TIGR03862 family)